MNAAGPLCKDIGGLAACYAHMGRRDDARETVERLRAITSVVMPRTIPLRNAEHRELYWSGLRLAVGELARAISAGSPTILAAAPSGLSRPFRLGFERVSPTPEPA